MCASCNKLSINGVSCHEAGCPDSWKDYPRECRYCGQEFLPENKEDVFCCQECMEDYLR